MSKSEGCFYVPVGAADLLEGLVIDAVAYALVHLGLKWPFFEAPTRSGKCAEPKLAAASKGSLGSEDI